MLERARIFSEVACVPTTTLTVDAQPMYRRVKQRLVDESRLSSKVNIVNLHEELRSRPSPPRTPSIETATGPDFEMNVDDNGSPFCRTLLDPTSRLTHRLINTRTAGSIYLEERRNHDETGNRTDRTSIRYTPDGETEHRNAGELYRACFDEIRGRQLTILIVDSKFSPIHFSSYEHPDVYKFHVLHGYLPIDAGHPSTGQMTSQRRAVLNAQECWDGIITLRDSNRLDHEKRFGPSNNRFNESNIVQRSQKYPLFSRRSRTRGVVNARLTPVKNVLRAMRIMKLPHQQDPRIKLDIYGRGPDEARLTKLKISMRLQCASASLEILLKVVLLQGSITALSSDRQWVKRNVGESHVVPGGYQHGLVRIHGPLSTPRFLNRCKEPSDTYLQVAGGNVARRLRLSINPDTPDWVVEGHPS